MNEVKYYKRNAQKVQVDFRQVYIISGRVREDTATVEDMQRLIGRLPPLKQQAIHSGEIESLAVLMQQEELTLCTFDSMAIRTLPFIDASERAISAERLLQSSGLSLSPGKRLDDRLSEEYFRSNLDIGKREFIQTAL